MNKQDKGRLGSPEAKIVESKAVDLDNPLLICGFPSSGLIGTIAVNEIIEQFDMERVAHLRSKYIPSAAVFFEGRLRHPFRIYASKKKNLLVAISEVPVDEQGMYQVSSCLLDWAKEKGARETVVLDGIPVRGMPSERKVLYASEVEKQKELEKVADLENLKKGIITGIAGSILSETLTRDMVGFTLLTAAMAMVPDPKGAAELLKAVDKLYDIDVSVEKLEESAEEVRNKMKEMAQQVESMRQQRGGQQQQDEDFQRLYG